ncbi:unnamed protein product [Paramecium primaurelia]|uniref:Transmembrane protein n=1 Tax=Paramecium primaurelia TaxID=5886 RepID=A0A8S1LSR0_PARPR|nr:unnamed protein product [Paramecium primaurelia]
MKKGLALIIIFFLLIQYTEQYCITQFKQQQSILKGNHKNVLQLQKGSLISSKKINFFEYGNNASFLKDNPYTIMTNGVDFTYCQLGKYISMTPMQKYLLNTLKIWLWEFDYIFQNQFRYYDIIIYAILNNEKTKIYENKQANCIVTIEFPDQFVEEFQVLNVGGNTINMELHIIKAEAYYKYS